MLNSLPQWQSAEGPLRRFVLGFWQGGRPAEQGETFRILPDGSLDLVWALGASPLSTAYGTTTRPREATLSEGALYFGVRFRPGTAHRFLDLIDLAQLTDNDAPCVLRRDRDLASRLAEARTFEDRVALIAARLDRLAADADAADLGETAARMIGAQGGQVRIEDLANRLGVTIRRRAARHSLLRTAMEVAMSKLKSTALAAALAVGAGTASAEPIFAGQQVGMYAGYVTEDLAATRAFFEQKLGFKPLFESDWFVLLALEGSQIAFLKPEQEGQASLFRRAYPGHGAWITFSVPNVDEVHQRAEAAGIPIAVPLRDEPWGERHFSVVAPGGLALDFVTYQGPLAQ